MKLGGYRTDGTLRVLIPGGMTVLLRGGVASPPIDDAAADAYGPWILPMVGLSWGERQALVRQLDCSRMVPLQTFLLAKGASPAPVDEEATEAPGDDSPAEESAEGDAPDAPADTPTDPNAAAKGELLDAIKKIAAERQKEKAMHAAMPRSGKKKFKLEFETEDQAGQQSPQPDTVQPGDSTPAPSVPTPDHLQPLQEDQS